jgi:hypothetical protein
MTKAFLVYIKQEDRTIYGVWTAGTSSFPISQSFPQSKPVDHRPILVIARHIGDVSSKYTSAYKIEELDVKDIVISENVDYLLEKR